VLFTITGKHIEMTDALRNYAQQKVSRLPRYYNSINKIEVVVDGNQGLKRSVEIIASAEHNKVFIAREAGEDTYTCIDRVVHKLERQLKKAKGKERDNKHSFDINFTE